MIGGAFTGAGWWGSIAIALFEVVAFDGGTAGAFAGKTVVVPAFGGGSAGGVLATSVAGHYDGLRSWKFRCVVLWSATFGSGWCFVIERALYAVGEGFVSGYRC